jgi:hypothetical protein
MADSKKMECIIQSLIVISIVVGAIGFFIIKPTEMFLILYIFNYFSVCLLSYHYFQAKQHFLLPYFCFAAVFFGTLLINGLLPKGISGATNNLISNTLLTIFFLSLSLVILIIFYRLKKIW